MTPRPSSAPSIAVLLAMAMLLLAASLAPPGPVLAGTAGRSPAPTASLAPTALACPSPEPYVEPVPGYPSVAGLLTPLSSLLAPVDVVDWAASGPYGVYADYDYAGPRYVGGHSIYLLDLVAGENLAFPPARGGWGAGFPDIDGQDVVWGEFTFADDRDQTGTNRWRVMAAHIERPPERVIARGANRRIAPGDTSAAYPQPKVDAGRVAWAEEVHRPGRPPWRIIVADLASGERIGSVPVGGDPLSFDLSGDLLGWVTRSRPRGSRLEVASIDGAWRRTIARGAWDVALSDERLVWAGVAGPDRPGEGIQMYSLPLDDLGGAPVDLSPLMVDYPYGATAPTVDGPIVAFNQDRRSGADLLLWDARRGIGVSVVRAEGTVSPGIGHGWLLWMTFGDVDDVFRPTAYGVTLEALREAMACGATPVPVADPSAGPSASSPAAGQAAGSPGPHP